MNSPGQTPTFLLRLWTGYPLLVPFYLMGKTPVPGTEKVEGGVPQLADYYLIGMMALVFTLLPFRISRAAMTLVWALVCFVGYTVLINLVWAAHLEDLSLVKNSLYYAYDVALLLTCLVLYANYGEAFLRATVLGVGASVILQVVPPLAPASVYSRQALFFNNENQLGYFCLLVATIFVVTTRRFAIQWQYQAAVYAAVAYLALLAQSRAALLGLGTLVILALVERPMRLLVGLGVATGLYLGLVVTPPLVSKSEERYVVQGEYDTPATRGYDRIVNYPEHILFGAGEGAYERFRSELFASEIHSSFGTLLFSYGIPGTLLFSLGIFTIWRRDPRVAVYMIPAFVQGIGHHGLRFAFFWAMLAYLCCLATTPEAEAEPQVVPSAAPETVAGPQPAT